MDSFHLESKRVRGDGDFSGSLSQLAGMPGARSESEKSVAFECGSMEEALESIRRFGVRGR